MSDELRSADEELMEFACRGREVDRRAFGELVKRHQGHVMANCRELTGGSADVEDLAQEVFTKAYFALRRFERRSSFRTWLRRIKINHCLNYLRTRNRTRTVSLEDPSAETLEVPSTPPDALQSLRQQEERTRIIAVLDQLGETLRVPLVLRDADGLSYRAIAAHLGISLSAVKMRVKRGREEFRERYRALQERDEEPVRAPRATRGQRPSREQPEAVQEPT